jgi:hypothetical protein
METVSAFAKRIRERYPEGLTGAVPIGGTRTAYILEQNRHSENPGHIPEYAAYMDYALGRTLEFIESFIELGGQNLILSMFSYLGFSERGSEYAAQVNSMCLRAINEVSLEFYHKHEIDPYFAGIDTLLHLPEGVPERELGVKFAAFHQDWSYQLGRRKIIWEVAPIPGFSFWRAHQVMGEAAKTELENEIASTTDLVALRQQLYQYYAHAAYGTDIPVPHFYLGTNRNGDMKLRSLLPISLLAGGPFRLYYLPYPTLFIRRETLRSILEDLAFRKPALRSNEIDYGERYSSELAEAEYQRYLDLSANPASVVGLTRSVTIKQDKS